MNTNEKNNKIYHHIGCYAFTGSALSRYIKLPRSKKEIERNLMERKKIHLKNFIREISRHKINYKSKLWTYSLCKQGLREGVFPRFYYRTTRNCWSWLSKNLRSIMQEETQDDKIVVRTLKALRNSLKYH